MMRLPAAASNLIRMSFLLFRGDLALFRSLFFALTIFFSLFPGTRVFAQDFIPSIIPPFTVSPSGSMGCDYMFVGAMPTSVPSQYLGTYMILDKDWNIVFYHPTNLKILDFQLQEDGRMSMYNGWNFMLMDSTFSFTDTIHLPQFYSDPHEFIIDSLGHFWQIGVAYRTSMDLSSLTTTSGQPGDTNATLMEGVIYELDAQQNVVKEWYGLDHYELDDVGDEYISNPGMLDFMHTNSIDLDGKGNVLISNRHLSEITLIDWATGDIIWRLGGKENQFTFIGDSLGLNSQHDARFLPGNRISVLDNGSHRNPSLAKGSIYKIDTVNMTATHEWAYARPIFSSGFGSMQYRADSARLINWGRTDSWPHTGEIDMVDPNGNLLWNLQFAPGTAAYRAFCEDIPWEIPFPALQCVDSSGYAVLSVDGNYSEFLWNTTETSSSIAVNDTGKYFAFIDYGDGYLRTQPFYFLDPNSPCAGVGIVSPVDQEPVLLGVFDLLGRAVTRRETGQVYIEIWSDGTRRKVVQF